MQGEKMERQDIFGEMFKLAKGIMANYQTDLYWDVVLLGKCKRAFIWHCREKGTHFIDCGDPNFEALEKGLEQTFGRDIIWFKGDIEAGTFLPLGEILEGRLVLKRKLYSNHPYDKHLEVVLAYLPEKKEYVTWMYNKECGGFNTGHYYTELAPALKNFDERKYVVEKLKG